MRAIDVKDDSRPRRGVRGALALLAACVTLSVAGCATDSQEASSTAPKATSTAAPDKPVVTHRLVRVKKSIPFSTEVVKSASLRQGLVKVQQAGRPGIRVQVMRVTYQDGKAVKREVQRAFVARQPVDRVRLRGTKAKPKPAPTQSCDSNYSGACVPVASDVDCEGGSGDGPKYTSGPVRVVGEDVYQLDTDGDGVACDS